MATHEIGASESYSEQWVELRVLRCGCGNPDSHRGVPCPKPREVVDIDPQQMIVVQTGA